MTTPINNSAETTADVVLDSQEFSSLVGNEIKIFSEQMAGQPLNSRVVLVNNRIISVDRTGNGGRIDSLVNNQVVTLQFNYKGEPVAIRGTLKKTQGGKCNIVLEEKAKPLALRRFKRFGINVPVKMARLAISTFDKNKIAKLRWLESNSANISAGGMLLELSGVMESDAYLVMNLAIGDVEFPSLVLGQVRYCNQLGNAQFRIGIEFLTKEMSLNRFERNLIKKLPQVMLEFDENTRKRFSESLSKFEGSVNS